jgi:hypothetical protein
MDVQQWADVRRRSPRDGRWESLRARLALARDLRDGDQMRAVLDDAVGLSEDHLRLLRAEVGVGLVRLGEFRDARHLLREIVQSDRDVQRPEAHVYYAQSLYRPSTAPSQDLDEAERVLKGVLVRRPGHPEVRALLGAVTKRRLQLDDDHAGRRAKLTAAQEYYRHDVERDLNLYYEGINVVALGTVLMLAYGDEAAGRLARELLPAVRVASRLAAGRPEARYWAIASLAECTLHEHLLDGQPDLDAVRTAYRAAGAERPPEGYLISTLGQLDFLAHLELPAEPLAKARAGLLEGAGRQA